MIKSILAVVLSFYLAGCSTTPTSGAMATPTTSERIFAYQTSKKGTIPITITRDSGLMGVACATSIYINGNEAAQIRSGERITLYVPIGETIIGVQQSGICAGGLVEKDINTIEGKQYYYRIGFDHNGATGLFPTATR